MIEKETVDSLYTMFKELQPEEFIILYLTKNSKSSNSIMVIHSDTINYATRDTLCVFKKFHMFLTRANSIVQSIGFDIDFNNETYTLVAERKNIYGINYEPIKVALNKEVYNFILERAREERLRLNTAYGISAELKNPIYDILRTKFEEKKRIISEYLDTYEEDNEEEN